MNSNPKINHDNGEHAEEEKNPGITRNGVRCGAKTRRGGVCKNLLHSCPHHGEARELFASQLSQSACMQLAHANSEFGKLQVLLGSHIPGDWELLAHFIHRVRQQRRVVQQTRSQVVLAAPRAPGALLRVVQDKTLVLQVRQRPKNDLAHFLDDQSHLIWWYWSSRKGVLGSYLKKKFKGLFFKTYSGIT